MSDSKLIAQLMNCIQNLTSAALVEWQPNCLTDGTDFQNGYVQFNKQTGVDTGLVKLEDGTLSDINTWIRTDSCECCKECEPPVVELFDICVRGFDYQELNTWDAGSDTMSWEVFVDGVSQGVSADQVVSQDNGNKSSWYAALMGLVNGTAWSMAVAVDVPSDNSGSDQKVTWTFSGPANSTLILDRQTGTSGDVMTLTTDASGTFITQTFEDNGSNIASNMFVACP